MQSNTELSVGDKPYKLISQHSQRSAPLNSLRDTASADGQRLDWCGDWCGDLVGGTGTHWESVAEVDEHLSGQRAVSPGHEGAQGLSEEGRHTLHLHAPQELQLKERQTQES